MKLDVARIAVLVVALATMPRHAAALGSAFTYQGQLLRDGSPTTDTCDLQFSLFDTASGGTQIGGTQTLSPVAVTNGVFNVQLNGSGQFGGNAFTGSDRWLQIAVRCPVGSGSYTTLTQRQPLTATPYAFYAPAAGSAAGLTCNGCVGTTNLAPNGVTAANIANGTITGTKILNGTITGSNVASGTLTGANVADGSLTTADIDFTTGNINLSDSTASAGNILKNGNPFIHNFGPSGTGSGNIFIGVNAGNFLMTGQNNSALGSGALFSNSTGTQNTATGSAALDANTTGHDNTANGVDALYANDTGSDNTAVGSFALAFNVSGSNNTALGQGSLQNNTADNNTAVGQNALNANTGNNACTGLRTPDSCCTDVGMGTCGSGNTAVGSSALASNTNGTNNTAVGQGALQASTGGGRGGNGNTAVGADALNAFNDPSCGGGFRNCGGNTAIGPFALGKLETGAANVAVGPSALLSLKTGGSNTAIGSSVLSQLTAGGCNVGIGGAGLGAALLLATTANSNVAIGCGALTVNHTGGNNTALGNGALGFLDGGDGNTAVGTGAGQSLFTGSNNIYIGNDGVDEDSNVIRIGTVTGTSAHTSTFIAGINGATSASGVAVFVNSDGQLGTLTSSARFKDDIQDVGEDSSGLLKLRPVRFRYKKDIDPSGLEQYGLVAEEVAKVYPDLVVYDDNGQPQTVRYHFVNAMLLNEVQKQARQIREQQEQISTLTARMERLEAAIDVPGYTQAAGAAANRSSGADMTANRF